MSNKESSMDSSTASRSISISLVRLSHSISRLSLSSTLICASIVGRQFNVAYQRRQGGKEERNSDLLIDFEANESEEIDMAVGAEKSDQDN